LVRIRSPAGKTAAGCSRLSFEPCKAVTVIHQVGVGLLRGSEGVRALPESGRMHAYTSYGGLP
jgi:hypothetical protein